MNEKDSSKNSAVCCICGRVYEGFGNNAEPVAEGRCCDKCNTYKVMPARLFAIAGVKPEDVTDNDAKELADFMESVLEDELADILDDATAEDKYEADDDELSLEELYIKEYKMLNLYVKAQLEEMDNEAKKIVKQIKSGMFTRNNKDDVAKAIAAHVKQIANDADKNIDAAIEKFMQKIVRRASEATFVEMMRFLSSENEMITIEDKMHIVDALAEGESFGLGFGIAHADDEE